MTYLINRLQQTGIITITYSGDVFVNDRINAMEEAHTLLKKNHDKKLIIDVRKINNKMTESEQEDFGVFLAEKFTSQKNKVAVIHPKKIPRQILSLMVLPFYMVAVWHNFILCKMPNYD